MWQDGGMKSTALLRWTPIAISAAVLMAACAAPVAAQSALDARNLVVPQWRHVVIPHPHPMPVPQPVERPVELAAVDAAISIDGCHAVTTLTITLKNPGGRPQESAVLLPVPAGAVFKGFQLDGVAGNIAAELMPRDEARRIYDEIVRRMIDPWIAGIRRHGAHPVVGFPRAAGRDDESPRGLRGVAGGGQRTGGIRAAARGIARCRRAMVGGAGLENARRSGHVVLPVASGGDKDRARTGGRYCGWAGRCRRARCA